MDVWTIAPSRCTPVGAVDTIHLRQAECLTLLELQVLARGCQFTISRLQYVVSLLFYEGN